MKIIVDANKIISAAISPYGKTSRLLLFTPAIKKYSPSYIVEEVVAHKEKIIRYSKLSGLKSWQVLESLFRRIQFVDEKEIPHTIWNKSVRMAAEFDPDDAPYVALALHLHAKLWTGDKLLLQHSSAAALQTITNEELEKFLEE